MEHTNVILKEDIEPYIPPDCEIKIEWETYCGQYNLWAVHSITLDWLFLYTEEFNSKHPVYSNDWDIIKKSIFI